MSKQPELLPNWQATVAQFTAAARTKDLPTEPTPMNKERVTWLCRMVMSELFELACTVAEPTPNSTQKETALAILSDAFGKIDTNGEDYSPDPIVQCAQQGDAIVDFCYYGLNVSAAHCIDTEPIFRLVHENNMSKVDARTGIVRRNEDGKIMKPEGHQPPDIVSEIKRQVESCRTNEAKRRKLSTE